MSTFSPEIVYVEALGSRESATWRNGERLTETDAEAAAQVHRDLAALASRATYDTTTEFGRVLRDDDRVLVEVGIKSDEDLSYRPTATVVVAPGDGGHDWAQAAARATVLLLQERKLTADTERLRTALALGWKGRTNPLAVRTPVSKGLAALVALVILLVVVRRLVR
jgi:hypothetical protein